MMEEIISKPIFARSLPLLGTEGINNLIHAKVAIFGLGGVGSYAAEALARSGIGQFELIDKDIVDASNLNRQLCALESTIGQAKVKIIANRIKDINLSVICHEHQIFYSNEIGFDFLPKDLDFIIDAIDDVKAKIDLIVKANQNNIPIISALGAGNKMDPTAFKIVDIYQTYNDPLAKKMRSELRKMGIEKQDVVFSDEKPIFKDANLIASLPFVPSVSGLICASYVIKKIAFQPDD